MSHAFVEAFHQIGLWFESSVGDGHRWNALYLWLGKIRKTTDFQSPMSLSSCDRECMRPLTTYIWCVHDTHIGVAYTVAYSPVSMPCGFQPIDYLFVWRYCYCLVTWQDYHICHFGRRPRAATGNMCRAPYRRAAHTYIMLCVWRMTHRVRCVYFVSLCINYISELCSLTDMSSAGIDQTNLTMTKTLYTVTHHIVPTLSNYYYPCAMSNEISIQITPLIVRFIVCTFRWTNKRKKANVKTERRRNMHIILFVNDACAYKWVVYDSLAFIIYCNVTMNAFFFFIPMLLARFERLFSLLLWVNGHAWVE